MADAVLQELGIENGRRVVFDRSRLRILLCDPNTSPEVVDLLQRCSYQVVAVQNARQVMEVLRNGMSDVDLILAEVELPKKKGFKMLKHITKEERLKQIPIVMMSSRDEMAVVVKCLRLGAADYLVKPLRTNELLNLWTHMWRRRRMLGMSEKHMINGTLNINFPPIDIFVSDTSESNTTSTDLFSDDSNDQPRRSVMDVANSKLASNSSSQITSQVSRLPGLELTLKPSSVDSTLIEKPAPKEKVNIDMVPSGPKKTVLKFAQSSAFLSYAKVNTQRPDNPPELRNSHPADSVVYEHQSSLQKHPPVHSRPSMGMCMGPPASHWEAVSSSRSQVLNANMCIESDNNPSSHGVSWPACEPSISTYPHPPSEQIPAPMMQMHTHKETLLGVPTVPSLPPRQLLPPPMVAPNMHPSVLHAIHLYHGLPQDGSLGIAPGLPPIHTLPPHQLAPPASFSYYPIALPVGHAAGWPSMVSMTVSERKFEQAERREAALNKFRQKRKDRCFEKKIRYVSRKRLAEQRPRNRGQFVRRTSDNEISGVVDESEEEYEEDENGSNDAITDMSPERLSENSLKAPSGVRTC
ncbi:pseudo-response regulator 1 [Marchantia polymorpha subsp. ruderalis]|uniref:Uncharacterized protein n=2 Tax=Marchantia polymorpha TaxID=3197 RepID=A0A176WQL9_MARPO|nr:hypothetical protein AXG93_2528s2010 [Marchantia polymorpha subsp. ruderalis]PTQ33871.1 hypothetical protein MARPO_0085s0081 [Marchantia polymorpha]PTQ33872.1 hypothetical protein MARPO_0085s0081 [Marchantia polymorpha]PTQ33873.1 hypothetical protein MARPO_0085s0081 [Marchantia polymorpha]BBN05003.1 hypothetical protein Mp_3g09460 [Marchantia polymorpha subsp. ruderalis]|eukprot:PTQ33871.1 hypothetical protein MARPO_0085s0081 [Marchantia polymorpha]